MRTGINAQLLAFSENYRQAGLSRYIYELVTRLPVLDAGGRYIAFVGNGPMPTAFRESKPENLRFVRSHLPTGRAPVRIAWEQIVLPMAAARARLDLLHCPVNVRPLFCPCPAIITIHDLIFLRYPQAFRPARRRYLSAMTRWSARHAAHIITVSEATRRDTIRLLGVPPDHVTTVHNGVGEQFKPLADTELAGFRRAKGLSGRVVLFVGTLEPRKNLTVLLNAFAALIAEPGFEDVTLYIGGSKGWYYDEVFATAESLGLAQSRRVVFLGRVPDDELPLWYNIASVFVYPSLYEGFGLPALEAMACGSPVLVSNTSSFPEVIGDAGLLLDPGQVRPWVEGLRRTLSDAEVAAAMREKGLQQAETFSWDRTARETLEIYRRVLAQRA